MNLMEIGKNPELQPTETAEQTKNSETITESLTQPSQTPEESPIKLKVERDILVQSFEKAKEFMRTQKKQIQTLEEEKQTILSDRQRLREEIRKSTVEIQRLTTELSETQKLNQSLQQSNDDLRNRNGLMSRNEQEQLEEEIKDVRDQNSKLVMQVNQSSVEAVEQAKKKQEDPPKGAPAWMNTFSDLMNLLLCFFVLLFSMSTVDTDKLEAVVASLQNAISILPTGGTSLGEGEMISAGVRQLEFLDSYYNEMANSKAENTDEQTDGKLSAQEQYEQQQLAESEKMADEIQQELDNSQLSGKVDVDFNAEYVKLNLNGSILFASGKADLVKQAVPIVNKLGKILEKYNRNVIEVEGHTDNVPIRYSAKYENNEVLSVYRALAVTDQLRKNKNLNPKYIKFAGRGDYIPVADNSTAEGRAQNRRVEIKIYNSFNSNVKENN